MTFRKRITYIVFYIGIVALMLFTYFYIQERYGRDYGGGHHSTGGHGHVSVDFSPGAASFSGHQCAAIFNRDFRTT